MKQIIRTNNWAGRAGLLLAVGMLVSAISARGDPPECSILKPYPMKKCVVDGKKLDQSGGTYDVSWQGREVKLCCEKCLPKFEKRSARYLRKIERAEKRAPQVGDMPIVPLAFNQEPGGVAWPGW